MANPIRIKQGWMEGCDGMKFSLRIITVVLCILLVFILASCSSDKQKEAKETQPTDSITASEPDTEEEMTEETQKETSEPDLDKAKDLNTQGYRLYKQGSYKEALALFKKSFEADDEYLFGHYNYACTIGVLMKQDSEK